MQAIDWVGNKYEIDQGLLCHDAIMMPYQTEMLQKVPESKDSGTVRGRGRRNPLLRCPKNAAGQNLHCINQRNGHRFGSASEWLHLTYIATVDDPSRPAIVLHPEP